VNLSLLAAQAQAPVLVGDGELTRGIAAVGIVLALLAVAAWLLRRGTFGLAGKRTRSLMRIEATVPLGERRSLMVVAVEGRRLLLGLTPAQISFVTELERGESFDAALSKATASPTPGAHTTP
jgi:flagellar biosynthetic protein FliO